MANSVDYYRKLIGSDNFNNEKEYLLSQFADNYNQDMQNYISGFEVMINSNRADLAKINGVEKRVLINYNSSFTLSKLEKSENTISGYMNDFKVGDYVELNDYNDNTKIHTYIITQKKSMREGYELGYMTECNNTLTFYNSLNKLTTIPCIMSNRTSYSDGLTTDRYTTFPDGKCSITVPLTEETKQFYVDQRFLFNHNKVFAISQPDDYTQPGLLTLTMIQEVPGENDDKENNIAYNPLPVISLDLMLDSKDVELGSTYQLIPNITKDSIVISEEVIYESSDENIATVDKNGLVVSVGEGNCTVTCRLKDNTNIYDAVVINVVPAYVGNNYEIVINGSSSITRLSTQKYISSVFNNGTLTTEPVAWSITGNTSYVQIVSQTSSEINIKCVNSPSTITLRATLVSDSSVYVDKVIQLKSAF